MSLYWFALLLQKLFPPRLHGYEQADIDGLSALPAAEALMVKFIDGPEALLFGLSGAVPAAICSWLAGYKRKESVTA